MPVMQKAKQKLGLGGGYPKSRTQLVGQHFPGAKGAEPFLNSVQKALAQHGIRTKECIALTNLCRDESTDKLKAGIDSRFGDAFNINGLGGVITAGATGIKAGLSHAPVLGGREAYVFFSFPHVAVDSKEGLGQIQRPGRAAISHACGALCAALGELKSNGVSGLSNTDLDPADLEYSALKMRLGARMQQEGVSDSAAGAWTLADITKAAERTITADLEALIAKTVDPAKANYAVIAGVQVHSWPAKGESGPTLEYIWPQKTYVVVNGQRRDLDLTPAVALQPAGAAGAAPAGGRTVSAQA